MAIHPILAALDDPIEAAYLAERRKARRRQWLVIGVGLTLILLVVGWKVGRHVVASAWLETNHHRVIWGTDAKNWRRGGATSVKYVQRYPILENAERESDRQRLAWLHRVEDLDLTTATGLKDQDLEILDRLTELRSLNLDRSKRATWLVDTDPTRLTDATLERVGRLKNLESLNISGHAITDAGLAHLKGLAHLQNLEIQQTEMTDAGLELLRSFPSLKSLDICGTRVTPEAVKKFEAARLDVIVIRDPDVGPPTRIAVPNRWR